MAVPDLLKKNDPPNPIMNSMPEFTPILGKPFCKTEVSSPKRQAIGVLKDLQVTVYRAFEETAEDRPGEFSHNSVGKNVFRHNSVTYGKFEYTNWHTLHFYVALKTLHRRWRSYVRDRLCHLDFDYMRPPKSERRWG
jgi:hypothetical protein